jgi:hypothetical protein
MTLFITKLAVVLSGALDFYCHTFIETFILHLDVLWYDRRNVNFPFLGPEDTVVFRKYLDKKTPVTQGLDNRIQLITSTTTSDSRTVLVSSATSQKMSTFSKSNFIHFSMTMLGFALSYF